LTAGRDVKNFFVCLFMFVELVFLTGNTRDG